jgi:cytochrome P450
VSPPPRRLPCRLRPIRPAATPSAPWLTCGRLNLNTSKLSFWILAYILHSPSLTALIRAEVAPALSRTGAPTDTTYLLTSCPHLEAVYHESLRLSMGSASIRRVVTPTAVGGTVLRPGRNVLVPARQLHGDAAVYGADVLRFDPDRFLRDKALAKSRSFRPFGGGSTLCPGRFLAKQQIFLWVALFLGRFDVDVVPGQPFPRYEEKKPSPGVMEPVEGDDVVFMLGRVN